MRALLTGPARRKFRGDFSGIVGSKGGFRVAAVIAAALWHIVFLAGALAAASRNVHAKILRSKIFS